MTGRKPPSLTEMSDVVGGALHLLAEIGAILTLLGIVALLAWLMLLIG